ncbi:hypothetical protein ACLB2K_075836 [Fragaria x ananassa]
MLMSAMDFVSTSIALTLAVTLAMLLIRHRNESLCEKKTRYHPVAGTALNQLINFPRLHHYMTELACKYTTYRLLHLCRSAVYTVDPANVEYMLKTNFVNYGKGLYLHSILSDVLGDGIFAVDGAKWRHQRKALSSEFSSKMLRDFSSAVFKLGAVKLSRVIATCDQAIDIQDLLMKSSLDSIVKILLGIELDSLCGTNEEGNRFSKAFDQANETALLRIIDIFWKIKRFLNIGREAALKENSIVIDQFVYNLIKSKIGIIHHLEDKQSLITKRDFVSRLLELNETDPKYLRDMVLSFMVAGKDSLAVTPSWFLYMMCKHLHIQEKIAQEVREVINLKDHSSVDELAACLTDEALKKMQYLHAALAETIRLYPAVPMDAKMCFSDDTWPDGFSIRKGDMVIYQPYAMGRMKFLWGDDAEEFRPERWLDKNGQFQDESPFKFTAFQAGPRICPGQEHAYMYMKIFAAVLLGSYMFKLADEKKVVNYKTMSKHLLLSLLYKLPGLGFKIMSSVQNVLMRMYSIRLWLFELCSVHTSKIDAVRKSELPLKKKETLFQGFWKRKRPIQSILKTWGMQRSVFSDDTWPDEFSVKKGDMVAYQPYAMGRMKFLCGDDAEGFGQRDGSIKIALSSQKALSNSVFQAGPRIFLGKEFAYREMKIFSAVLLRYYTFKLSEKKIGVNYRTMINL